MQVYPDKLDAQLQRELVAAYLVAGDDPLLLQDAFDAIRNKATSSGFTNVESTTQESGFSWQAWLASASEMSLFGDQRLLVLRLASAAIGSEGSKVLCDYLANPSPDAVLLVTAPRVSGKPKWVGQFTSKGVYVPVYPLEPSRLPQWLVNRGRQHGLALQHDAAQLLADRIEGNLMAGVQELEKLALLHAPAAGGSATAVDAEQVADAVGDSARFSAFNMLDHALAAEPRAACRALLHLRGESNAPVELVGAIAYELRTLATLLEYKAQNRLGEGIKATRSPMGKRDIYQRALPRLAERDIERCTLLAEQADLLAKSSQHAAAFSVIEMLLLRLAGTPLPAEQIVLQRSGVH